VWSDKGDHGSLDSRPKPRSELYGTVSNSDYVKFLYQSLPGVGPKQAALIYNKLGMIFRLVATEDDLVTVPGIGKGRARKIVEVFSERNSM
jgi:Holliday junction resolvasome RuvABC DNA-binding subunit